MTPRTRAIVAVVVVCVLAFLFWRVSRQGGQESQPTGLVTPPATSTFTAVVAPVTPTPVVKPVSKPVVPSPAIPTPSPVTPPTPLPVTPVIPPVTPPTPVAPEEQGLHKELIPRNITIVRCYYEQEVVAPGTTFGFDINGSGFTESFQQMITVDFDALDVEPQNLRLVTANQIHGEVVVGPNATTQYIHPRVLIRGLPVFKAPEPFGVVRRGEVLDITLTGIDESGQSGQFQVITNLDRDLFKRFSLQPTTERLEVSDIFPKLPFYVNGTIRIAPGVRSGEYGLTALMGQRVLLKRDPLVDVVKPTVGRTGSIENVRATPAVYRPGDRLELSVTGSGFTSVDTATLRPKISGVDPSTTQVEFVTAGKVRMTAALPPDAKVGVYGVIILQKGNAVFERKRAYAVVPPNWLGGVSLPRPLAPGQSGVVHITGRDLSPDFVQKLKVEVDEPGLTLSPIRQQDPSTLVIDIKVAPTVAPGDYILHLSVDGKEGKLPGGQIIKIQ